MPQNIHPDFPTAAELRHEMREELTRLREINAALLAACERLDAWWDGDGLGLDCPILSPDTKAVWRQIKAAIAKAREEEG